MIERERFRRNVVIAVAIVVAVSAAPVHETDARFVDSDGADGALGAGVLDPHLSQIGPATADGDTAQTDPSTVAGTWADYTHATDGSDAASNTLELSTANATVSAAVVNLTVSYVENDTADGTSDNAESTARTIVVEEFVYDETDLVDTTLVDENGNDRIDIDDLTMAKNDDNLSRLSGIDAGATRNVTVTLSGRATLLDITRSGDGIDFRIAIRTTRGSFVDADDARANTIQYA